MAGHQCCSNPPTLDPSAGAGHVERLCGLSTYVTGSPNAKHAIILISDVFGYEAPKLRSRDKGFEEAKPIIETLKSKGASSVGAAGFCWGGKVVVELSKVELIQAAVILHPTWVTVDDIKGVKVPIAILAAEIDDFLPPELLKQYDEALTSQSKVDFYVKMFPKVIHGWTTRYEDEDEVAVKSAEEAHQNLLDWFAKYIK
ncbi:endo-1 [Quercus suber]|uniref:Endo-1 n=1 Tax=Quercus suber TaxID=58331 RepID=A0AAW0L5S1_QUESU